MSVLKAAISAGADACYLAGNSFGARAYADNFTNEELISAIEFAHLYGVKIYLTVNTLIKENEMERLYSFLEPLYVAGLDAVLVQDLGVFRLIKEAFPDLPIHTSTQMNILSPEGARLLKKLGAQRIVAAREMTVDELKRIRSEVDIEVEAFVHGAMCLCYSGRCLMSSMAGGRSGNRGRCAQPCRMKYEINNNSGYKLSMRDMCTLKYIPQLVDAGVDSFKIEGRLKNEYYVAAAVDAYKKLTMYYLNNEFTLEKAEFYEKRLLDTFNRGGFTSGYLMKDRKEDSKWEELLIDDTMPGRRGLKMGNIQSVKNGSISIKLEENLNAGDDLLIDFANGVMITSGKNAKSGQIVELQAPETRKLHKGINVYRTRNKSLMAELDQMIASSYSLPLSLEVYSYVGKELSIKVSYKNKDDLYFDTQILGQTIEEALSKPTTKDIMKEKLSALGDTEFYLESIKINSDEKGFIPMKELKNLRRIAIEKIKEKIIQHYRRSIVIDKSGNIGHLHPERNINVEVDNILNINLNYEYDNVLKRFINNEYDNENNIYISISNLKQMDVLCDTLMKGRGDDNALCVILDLGMGQLDYSSISQALDSFYKLDLKNAKTFIGLAHIDTDPSNKLKPYIDYGIFDMVDGIYIRCIDDLALLSEKYIEKTFIIGSSLYTYNRLAVTELISILKGHTGPIIFEESLELNQNNINDIYKIFQDSNLHINRIKPFFGRFPLMITKGLRETSGILNDEKGNSYNVIKNDDFDYNLILSSSILSLSEYKEEISSDLLYSFTCENIEETRRVLYDIFEVKDLSDISDKKIKDYKALNNSLYTIGHYKSGIQ